MKYFLLGLIFSQVTFASVYNSSFNEETHEGFECEGTEFTAAALEGFWGDYLCLKGEWMIRVKNHLPVTVKLEPRTENLYALIPTIPTDSLVRSYLRQHWFKIDFNGEVGMIRKGKGIE